MSWTTRDVNVLRHAAYKVAIDDAMSVCDAQIKALEAHTDPGGIVTGPDFNASEIAAIHYVKERLMALRIENDGRFGVLKEAAMAKSDDHMGAEEIIRSIMDYGLFGAGADEVRRLCARPECLAPHHRSSPGFEAYGFSGEEERLDVEHSLSNGMRISVTNDDLDGIAHLHIRRKTEALKIAAAIAAMADEHLPDD